MRFAGWTVLCGMVMAAPMQASMPASDPAPRVAVAEFELALSGRTLPPPGLGESASQLMVDQLVTSGEFRVYDAQWIGRRGPNGHLDVDRMRGVAEQAGVDYLVLGTITSFSEEQKNRQFGGAIPVPLVGGFGKRSAQLKISVLVKMIDVRTGEIVTTATGLGGAKRSSVGLGALSLLHFAGGGYGSQSVNARDAQLGEAMSQSIALASRGLVAWRHR